jgi:hypothetical protein
VGEVGCREGGDAGGGRGHESHEFGLQAVGERVLEGRLVVRWSEDWVCLPFDHIAAGRGGGF